jgi:hypothetical protein
MKNHSVVVLMIICIFGLIFTACERNLFTFNAKIDGTPFDVDGTVARFSGRWIDIDAVQSGREPKMILFHIDAVSTGTYKLESENETIGSMAAYHTGSYLYSTNSRFTGEVKITVFDMVERKISGSFKFQAVQIKPAGSRVVNVEGSFEDVPIKEERK